MIAFGYLVLWVLAIIKLSASYSWTPVSPDQKFPLPDVKIPHDPSDDDDLTPDVSGNASLPIARRWVSLISPDGDPRPWPINGILKRRNRIRFCWAYEVMKDNGRCTFMAALDIWSQALGGEPGKASGHNLGFSEVTFLGKPQYCYKPGTTERNPLVPNDALSLLYLDAEEAGGVSFGTLGYIPKALNKKEYRHVLQMSSNAPATTIAHEIGHILGLEHEHVRADRDEYLEFRCLKIRGLTEALYNAFTIAQREGFSTAAQDLQNQLCTNITFAQEAKFAATEYIKVNSEYDREHSVDFDSIMIYSSAAFATLPCLTNIRECPLVKYDIENGVKVGASPMNLNMKPSERDVAFVKKFYPWKG